jgi:aldose 1-epimerase
VTGAAPRVAGVHELVSGSVVADVSETAASLRRLSVDGVELVRGTLDDEPPLAAGMVLVPWPNRVEGGRWALDGAPQQLELTEPELGHANHGLLSRTRYSARARSADRVLLSAPVAAAPGYPFDLGTTVEYGLTATGVEVTHVIVNLSRRPAPVAIGAHPYLRIGDVPVGDLTLQVDAGRALTLDDRHIPRGSTEVTGTPLDLRQGRRVRDVVPHGCYTELGLEDGLVQHRLRAADGREVRLWAEPVFSHVQVFVTGGFPTPSGPASAIAIEPMTAPPNALRTGESLRWLDPGERWTARWGIRLG